MTWLAWRQARTETLGAALLFAIIAALLVPTGLHMAHVFARDGLAACVGGSSTCSPGALSSFEERFGAIASLLPWLNLVPAVIGALFAAPIVLDIEHGTFRLAWTQSVTRGRWLAVRLGVMALGAIVFGELLARLIGWWRGPLDQLHGRLSDAFEFEGVTPAAYALFAAALVLAVGVVSRRTALAVLVGVVLFLGVRVAVELELRPHYQSPVRTTWTGTDAPNLDTAWVLNQGAGFRSTTGRAVPPEQVAACFGPGTKQAGEACLQSLGLQSFGVATYQPNGRFWRFQLTEAALYAAFAALLIAAAAWRIRRLA
jgi:hypothetical protein